MNSHHFDHILSENAKDVMRSVELFLAITFVLSVIGIVFVAVV